MSFKPKPRPDFISIIPQDLQEVFQITDVPKVFDYMEKTFHLNKIWREVYKERLSETLKSIPDEEVFFRFVREEIEPPLRRVTQKKDLTFNMVCYLLKDRIAELKKEKADRIDYYKSDKWKQK